MKTVLCFLGLMSCAHAQEVELTGKYKEIYDTVERIVQERNECLKQLWRINNPSKAQSYTGMLIDGLDAEEYIGAHITDPEQKVCILKVDDECVIRWADNALHFSRPIKVTVQQKP